MKLYRDWRLFLILGVLALVLAACQPAPAPTPAKPAESKPAAAAPAAVGKNLILMTDVVQGSKNLPPEMAKEQSCVLNNKYPRNSQIVWRSRVFDPATSAPMDDKAIKTIEIQLANGVKAPMKFGPHPKEPPNESFWTGSWVIPKDAPTGTLNFKIVATANDGRTGEFVPFPVAGSLLQITDKVLADYTAPPAPTAAPKS